MGFPREVRDQILIASARHCCVCHRYKGVKVEVHHIQQEADGGENTFDNAIALCFDCHADAGHYNPKHPRGAKFSPAELREAKNNWIDIVANNNITQPSEPDQFYCRYFLCKNYEHLVEIAEGNLSRFPVENPLLVKNSVIDVLDAIIRKHPHSYRHANARGAALTRIEEYIELHPDAVVPDPSEGNLSYFEVVRTPSKEELRKLEAEDGLLEFMLDADLPLDSISLAVGYRDDCGGIPLQKEYIFRKIWCSFLAITNISNMPKALSTVNGRAIVSEGFHPFSASTSREESFALPGAPVPPNATVLIPLALILPPFRPLHTENWSEEYDDGRHVQVVRHEGMLLNDLDEFLVFGNQILPIYIGFDSNGHEVYQQIHPFDLSNLYTIDRFWECGSCPHLFFNIGEKLSYARELLSNCSKEIGIDRFIVPPNATDFVIAEIEDEITEISLVKINNSTILENICLKKNQYIKASTNPGDLLEVVGKYVPDVTEVGNRLCGIIRNELVGKFLSGSNKDLTNAYTRAI